MSPSSLENGRRCGERQGQEEKEEKKAGVNKVIQLKTLYNDLCAIVFLKAQD